MKLSEKRIYMSNYIVHELVTPMTIWNLLTSSLGFLNSVNTSLVTYQIPNQCMLLETIKITQPYT